MSTKTKTVWWNQSFNSIYSLHVLATSILSNYLWVLCIIKCTTSKFEVSLFPPLERTGLLQQLSLFNTGLGRSRSTTTWLKWNSKANKIHFHLVNDTLSLTFWIYYFSCLPKYMREYCILIVQPREDMCKAPKEERWIWHGTQLSKQSQIVWRTHAHKLILLIWCDEYMDIYK